MKKSNDLDSFLKKIDDVESIIKDLKTASDEDLQDAMVKADQYLEEKKEKNVDKTGFNRSMINKVKHEPKANADQSAMNQEEFMKFIEQDSNERFERKKEKMKSSLVWKNKGNDAFRAGKFQEAVDNYTKAIGLAPDQIVYYSNRAQAYIKLGKYQLALDDCDIGMKLDERHIKLLIHKARALASLYKYEEASDVLDRVLTIDHKQEKLVQEYRIEFAKKREIHTKEQEVKELIDREDTDIVEIKETIEQLRKGLISDTQGLENSLTLLKNLIEKRNVQTIFRHCKGFNMFSENQTLKRLNMSGQIKSKKEKYSRTGSVSSPGQLTEKELNGLECHFNWEICSLTPSSIKEKINSVLGHIEENAEVNLPQSYCLLAYLESLLTEEESKSKVYGHFQKALDELKKRGSKEDFIGYYAVIVANMLWWETRNIKKHEKAREHFIEYIRIKDDMLNKNIKIEKHPEVLAMKGFALGYSFGHKRSVASVDAYEEALLHNHRDRVQWLFGLAHSKNHVSNKARDPLQKDLSEIELIYRQVIDLDSKNSLAMMKLARILLRIHKPREYHSFMFMEEVKYWIDKALALTKYEKVSILEQAGRIYLNINLPEKNQQAKQLFEKAFRLKPESKNAQIGLGDCHRNEYFAMKKSGKATKKKLLEELKKAEQYFNLEGQVKRHYENLKLAQVYSEMEKCNGIKDKAENIYKDVINKARKEDDRLSLAQSLYYYSKFLKNKKRIKEEIECFKELSILSVPEDEEQEMRFIHDSQDRLLYYIDNSDHINKDKEGNEWKALIQKQRGNIYSAAFYYELAGKKEDEIRCFLDASENEDRHPPVAFDLTKRSLEKARVMLENLSDSEETIDLKKTYQFIHMEKTTEGVEKLETLVRYKTQFEELCAERSKFLLENEIGNDQDKEKEKKENESILEVLDESKSVLDGSINFLRNEIFSLSSSDHIYYPNKGNPGNNKSKVKTKMKKLFEQKYGMTNFSQTHEELFEFLLNMQPNEESMKYRWLQNVFEIRNEKEHNVKAVFILTSKFSDREERVRVTREVFDYTVEVCKRIEKEVNQFRENPPS